MRKVLLTTTALVALGGVSAASALDISGYQRFSYSSWDDTAGTAETGGANDTSFFNRNRMNFTHEIVSDSGLTVGGYLRLQQTNTNAVTETYEEVYVDGDFGSLRFGNRRTAGASIYTSVINNGDFLARSGQTAATDFADTRTNPMATTTDGAADLSATYASPNFNGFSLMTTYQDGGDAAGESDDTVEVGIQYAGSLGSAGNFSVHALNADTDDSTGLADDEIESSQFGFEVGTGPFRFNFQREIETRTDSDDTENREIKTNEYAVRYAASDSISLGVIKLASDEKLDTTNNPKLDSMIYGVNYTVFPGFLLQASHMTFDYEGATDNDGSSTTVGLRVSF